VSDDVNTAEPFVGTRHQYIELLYKIQERLHIETTAYVYGATEYRGVGSVLLVVEKDNGLPFTDSERAEYLATLQDYRPIGTTLTVAFGEPVR
jgi:hypothetical protein